MATLQHPTPTPTPAPASEPARNAPATAGSPAARGPGIGHAGPGAPPAARTGRAAPRADELGRDLALPVGAAVAAVAVTALLVTGQAAHLTFSLAAFALLTVAVTAAARLRLVPAVVLVSWMFFDGFVVHQRAELAWHQADRASFWVLAAAGLAGAVCAGVARVLRAGRVARAVRARGRSA
ncbi:hypothetical protein [Streptomyces rhizoryzae]|uniref:hypothetical protein n=1 Tax=Streptomyces rhizoryzae TaxID=2932493 RepID=UPI00249EA814|nr:hypothetical protein [Streptomyces rhizoryzae]